MSGDGLGVPSTRITLDRIKDDQMLDKKELAEALGCSVRTLQRMVERHEIPPPIPFNGRKVWIVGNVKAWIAEAVGHREAKAKKEALRLRAFSD